MNFFGYNITFQKTNQDEPLPEPRRGEVAISEEGFFGTEKFVEKIREDRLLARRGDGIYRTMLQDDQVKAGLSLFHAAVTGRKWFFDVTDPDTQQEMADVFTHNFERTLKGTFRQAMKAILVARIEGYSVTEKVYGTFEFEGKPWWGVEAFKTRPVSTITVEVDPFSNVESLIQDQNGNPVKLPMDKFVYAVNQADFDPHYGLSELLPVYEHWWSKTNILKFWNMFLERFGGGFILATTQESLTETQKTDLRSVLKNLQTATSITAPKGVDLKLEQGKDMSAFKDAVFIRNGAILRALLVPTLIGFGEEGATGSEARAKAQLSAWWLLLDDVSQWLADIINEQVITELSRWNFGSVDFPLFKFEQLTSEQKAAFAKQWMNAVKGNAVRNTFEDELRIRDLLSFPAREEDAEPVSPSSSPVLDPSSAGRDQVDGEPGIEIPDGQNPLASANQVLINAAEDEQPLFRRRVDLEAVKDDVYGTMAKSLERTFSTIASESFIFLTSEVLKASTFGFENVANLIIPEQMIADATNEVMKEITPVFNRGRQDALETVNKAAQEHGDSAFPAPKKVDPGEVVASEFARVEMALKYALSATDAESFLQARMLEITSDLMTDEILATIKQTLISGLRSEQTVEMMIEEAQASLKNILGKEGAPTAAHIATVVRTALSESYNEGLRSFYEDPELGGYVKAYQYDAVMDEATTPFCRAMDGRIWPVASPGWRTNIPPNHFNCRSTIIPVVKGDRFRTSGTNLGNDNKGNPIAPAVGFGGGAQ